MERQTQVNIRLHLEEKAAILKRAKEEKLSLSDFMRRAALKGTKQPERKLGSYIEEAAEQEREASTFPPAPKPLEEISLPQLITQLKGQGMTTPVATREAKKRLGL